MFLAQVGSKAGTQVGTTLASREWITIVITGFAITPATGAAMFLTMKHVFKIDGTQLSGMISGMQAQPTLLTFANDHTGANAKVALGYALMYPAAMIAKIFIAQVLTLV